MYNVQCTIYNVQCIQEYFIVKVAASVMQINWRMELAHLMYFLKPNIIFFTNFAILSNTLLFHRPGLSATLLLLL